MVREIAYGGWQRCKALENGQLELIITAEVGPRIIRCSLAGRPNLLGELARDLGQRGGNDFRLYGGHRLWHAPEAYPRSYAPDNDPPEFHEDGLSLRITPPPEAHLGIQKALTLTLHPSAPLLTIEHTLTNIGYWTIELAPWALTICATGGTAVVPLPPKGTHPEALLPNGSLALWPYTDLSDPRWHFGSRYLLLRQDPTRNAPQKLGVYAPDGWAAYAAHGMALIKLFAVDHQARYPDFGSTVELFVNQEMLELETLGPLTPLAPGASVTHTEHWYVADGIAPPSHDDDAAMLLVHLSAARQLVADWAAAQR